MTMDRVSALCPSCGFKLISPLWSDAVGGNAVANRWQCVICSSSFETVDHLDVVAMGVSEQARAHPSLN